MHLGSASPPRQKSDALPFKIYTLTKEFTKGFLTMINVLNTSLFFLANAIASDAIAKEQAFSSDALIAVAVIGFLAATGIGSIAWYNSKRPPGWEGKERPPVVPDVEPSDHPGLGTPE